MSVTELERAARSMGTAQDARPESSETTSAAIETAPVLSSDERERGPVRGSEARWERLVKVARSWPLTAKVAKYASTSVLSTVISEVTLLILYSTRLAGAAEAAVAATVTGGILSYVLSRYWIWPHADRSRPGRQLVWYWVIAFVGLVASTWVTGETASHADEKGVLRVAVVGLAYLATYATLWVVKFVLYQRLLFADRAPAGR